MYLCHVIISECSVFSIISHFSMLFPCLCVYSFVLCESYPHSFPIVKYCSSRRKPYFPLTVGSLHSLLAISSVSASTKTVPSSLSPYSSFSLTSFDCRPLLICSVSTAVNVSPSSATNVYSTHHPLTTQTLFLESAFRCVLE